MKMKCDELPNRRPLTPGEHLRDILEENVVTQQQFADALGITRRRLNEILNGRRGITPDTALRLGRVLNTSAELWLRLQNQLELWDAVNSPNAKAIAKLKPLKSFSAAQR
jgi:addiction module HigA family antidote